ncbi:MAG: electron transfer flavoprotein subunit alpha/FixB family protein, partial [Acidimicrobiia bacterium]
MALSKAWVFAESEAPGKPTSMTLELLTRTREVAEVTEAVYVGADGDSVAEALGAHGATTVYAIDPG